MRQDCCAWLAGLNRTGRLAVSGLLFATAPLCAGADPLGVRVVVPREPDSVLRGFSDPLLLRAEVRGSSNATVQWRQIEGPAPSRIDAADAPITFVQFTREGTYRFEVVAQAGRETAGAGFKVRVEADPNSGPTPAPAAGAGTGPVTGTPAPGTPPANPPASTGFRYSFDKIEGGRVADTDPSRSPAVALVGGAAGKQASAPESAEGRHGRGAKCNGVDQALVTPPVAVSAETGWTAACWVRAESFAGTRATRGRVVLQQTGPKGRTWLLVLANGELRTYLGGKDLAGGTLELGRWHHVALTRAAGPDGVVRIYIDGREVAATAQPLETESSPFHVGRHKELGRPELGPWHGDIDEVALVNRALSEAEIRGLAGLDGKVPASGP